MKNSLRWIAVLPAAIGAYFAAVAAENILLYIVSRPTGDYGAPWWTVILNNIPLLSDIIFRAIGAYFFVFVGAIVAPKAKFPTALVLATIIGVFMIGGTLLVIFGGLASNPIVAYLAEMLFTCVAAAVACFQEYGKEQDRKQLSQSYDINKP